MKSFDLFGGLRNIGLMFDECHERVDGQRRIAQPMEEIVRARRLRDGRCGNDRALDRHDDLPELRPPLGQMRRRDRSQEPAPGAFELPVEPLRERRLRSRRRRIFSRHRLVLRGTAAPDRTPRKAEPAIKARDGARTRRTSRGVPLLASLGLCFCSAPTKPPRLNSMGQRNGDAGKASGRCCTARTCSIRAHHSNRRLGNGGAGVRPMRAFQ